MSYLISQPRIKFCKDESCKKKDSHVIQIIDVIYYWASCDALIFSGGMSGCDAVIRTLVYEDNYLWAAAFWDTQDGDYKNGRTREQYCEEIAHKASSDDEYVSLWLDDFKSGNTLLQAVSLQSQKERLKQACEENKNAT